MRWLRWDGLDKHRDVGLLIVRVGLGCMFVVHGWPKLTGGPETWTKLGGAMETFGVTFAPMAWGLAAALSEAVGGALLALGLATRPAAAAMAFTMLVAVANHVADGGAFRSWSHAAEVGVVFLALILLGPGKYSLDARLR